MRIIKGLFGGFFIGVLVVLILYALGFLMDVISCITCLPICADCVGIDCYTVDRHYMASPGVRTFSCGGCLEMGSCIPIWSVSRFIYISIFLSGAGAIIGTVYGIAKHIPEARIIKEKKLEYNSSYLENELNSLIEYCNSVAENKNVSFNDLCLNLNDVKSIVDKSLNELETQQEIARQIVKHLQSSD